MELSRTLDLLCRAAERGARSWSMEEGCSGLVRAAKEALGCRSVALMLLADGGLALKVVVHRGLTDHWAYHHRPSVDQHPALDRVVRGGEMMLLDDARGDPDTTADLWLEKEPGSVLAVPVRMGSTPLGCLICDDDAAGAFDDTAARFCCLVGHLVSTLYTRAELHRQEQSMRLTDPKTGLYSLNFFCDRLEQEMARARRYGHDLTVLVLDIDNLDHYRQMHGGQAGARALDRIIDLVQNERRPIDTLGKYHHDQLAMILPETDVDGAVTAAERIRSALADADLPHDEPQLTLSAGVASFADQNDPRSLLEEAQRAVYRAQLRGGNRVTRVESA